MGHLLPIKRGVIDYKDLLLQLRIHSPISPEHP